MGILSFLANLIAYSPDEVCQLETSSDHDKHTLVANDGSLVTLLALRGTYRYYSQSQEFQILEYVSNELRQVFEEEGYQIDFVLDVDASRSATYVDEALSSMDVTTRDMGYQSQQVNKDEKALLASIIKPEVGYIVLTTKPSALDKLNNEEAVESIRDLANEFGHNLKGERGTKVQNQWLESQQMHDAHKSFTDSFTTIVSEYVLFTKLKSHSALTEIRSLLYREFDYSSVGKVATADNSKVKIMSTDPHVIELQDIGHPSIHSQIVEEEFHDASKTNLTFFNGKCYATLERYMVGDEMVLMRSLTNKIARKIPYRIVYSLVSGSQQIKSQLNTKAHTTSFVARTSKVSSDLLNACDAIVEFINGGGCAVKCYMSVTVWGDTEKETTSYYKSVQAALQTWGGERQRVGSFPVESLLSSLPSYSAKPIGAASCDSLYETMKAAPLVRTSSPWKRGVMMYSTIDCKPWPIDFDDLQTHHLIAVSGSMGSGKSIQMAYLARAIQFIPGTTELPLFAGVDYGESIIYFAQSVISNLKEEDKQKAAVVNLDNNKQHAYNLLEPQYGYNRLASTEINTATAFLAKIVNGGSEANIHEQLDACISSVIDLMVEKAVDQPRIIDPSQKGAEKILEAINSPNVSKYLVKEARTSYLNARNAMYKASIDRDVPPLLRRQYLMLSKAAHRYIWPLVADIPSALQQTEVKAILGKFTYGNGLLIDAIGAAISLSCNRYKALLGHYPMADYSDVSMMFVNAKPIVDSAPDSMRNAWFILAKGMSQRHFWVHPDDVKKDADPVFYNRAMIIAKRKKPIPKYYYQDEYEQAACHELDTNIEKETKTARKYRQTIALATQLYHKFPPAIRGLATNTLVCNIPDVETEIELKRQFSLTEDEMSSLKPYVGKVNVIKGKGRGLLYIGKLKAVTAPIVQPIVSLMPEGLVWSLANDAEDVDLRMKVQEIIAGRLSYDQISTAMGSALGYPNMKKLIKDRVAEEGINDKVVIQECLDRVMKTINNSGLLS
ncbi:hypothetical protein OCT63_18890 [Vibrio sp. RW]|uniref:hypothetical protein n=1 Tax=Vibrio sp. RW TaxID=2998833 RepID=UPI0022CD7C1D|nr:hypothetical protein [Vibrio sp. RW]MDA0146294.1 hypothetical protein [Vibrio sp. RW]